MPAARQPVIFVPHGGGPCFWIEFPPPFGPHAWDNLRDYLAGVLKSLPERPKAFLVVTAHWETDQPTVSVNPKPGMLYDYNGFPPHTYKLSYPAPGDPELAAEVKRLIEAAGLPVATDGERGFDHGVFVPFLILDPKAEIPVVMLSLRKDLDPAFHIKLGKALAPLHADVTVADIREFELPPAGLILIQDVLQCLSAAEQSDLLQRCCSALAAFRSGRRYQTNSSPRTISCCASD